MTTSKELSAAERLQKCSADEWNEWKEGQKSSSTICVSNITISKNLRGYDLSEIKVTNSKFIGNGSSQLNMSCDFAGATFKNVTFLNYCLNETNFTEATLKDTIISNCNGSPKFWKVIAGKKNKFWFDNKGLTIEYCKFQRSDFSRSKLYRSNFLNCHFEECCFDEIYLECCEESNSSCDDCSWKEAHFDEKTTKYFEDGKIYPKIREAKLTQPLGIWDKIHRFFSGNTHTIFVGPPKSGKSTFALFLKNRTLPASDYKQTTLTEKHQVKVYKSEGGAFYIDIDDNPGMPSAISIGDTQKKEVKHIFFFIKTTDVLHEMRTCTEKGLAKARSSHTRYILEWIEKLQAKFGGKDELRRKKCFVIATHIDMVRAALSESKDGDAINVVLEEGETDTYNFIYRELDGSSVLAKLRNAFADVRLVLADLHSDNRKAGNVLDKILDEL